MLNGWFNGERTGSGTIVWKQRERLAAGEIDYNEFIEIVASSAPVGRPLQHHGHRLDDELARGSARHVAAGLRGDPRRPIASAARSPMRPAKRIVEMVWEDLKPSDILTRKAFENCIVVNSAIGGSTNAPIHINALARHIGVELSIDDWQKHGHDIPLLVNMQPAGFYLGEEYHRAGGVPAVVRELMAHKRIHEDAVTGQRPHHGRELPRGAQARRRRDLELRQAAGEGRRLPGAARQSVRFRDHEDQRDLEGIPRPLFDQSQRT
jgi:dihydroxy-acid dehydratase